MRPDRLQRLTGPLDALYQAFDRPDSAADPIHLVRRYPDSLDREVVGFCAAALAFGRVASILQSIERVLAVMGERPARFVRTFDPTRDGRGLRPLVHRWTDGADLVALLWILRGMLERSGSIEGFFLEGDAEPRGRDVGDALDRFSACARAVDLGPAYGRVPRRPGVWYFFPRPSDGSACKRLNLFLRWMVRRDRIDLGVWTRVSPSRLIVPLDTHVIRVARCLGLTRYRSPGWRMAAEITASLRAIDPGDPVKYDFSLCHLGMMQLCSFTRGRRVGRCPLQEFCRPSARRRRAWRGPSART